MRSLDEIKNIKGKVVLVRVDFNLPMTDGKVEDDFRIKKALPTIKFLQSKGARLVLISHFGKGGKSLAPVGRILNKFLKAKFVPDILGRAAKEAAEKM
jgi:phosphoglycerate kinase